MAVTDITFELAARNPTGAKTKIAETMHSLDEGIAYLHLAADSAATGENEERLIRGLYLLHRRLRRDCDQLMQLL